MNPVYAVFVGVLVVVLIATQLDKSMLPGDYLILTPTIVSPALPNDFAPGTMDGESALIPLDYELEDDGDDAETAASIQVRSAECDKHTRRNSKPGKYSHLQYIHIPKAGGSTIQYSLWQWAKPKLQTYIADGGGLRYNCPPKIWRNPGKTANGAILMGHRGFGFCRALEPNEDRMTFAVAVREPVSRVRSLFDYILTSTYWEFEPYHRKWKHRDFSQLVIEAEQARQQYPAGAPERFTYDRFYEFSHQQTNFLCGWECTARSVRNCTNEDVLDANLQRALVNLERCDIVVVMEQLDDMIIQFEYQTQGLVPEKVRGRFPLENKHNGKKSVVTPEAMKILESWNRRDTVLYNAAKLRHNVLTNRAKQCVIKK
ncbi:hypothetical protein BASA81_001314 [Batrachochytrium salamandrivorans]|nr:hypothetical protein BASA81_001314 [Batrachochytrium salamandrivorans]